MAATSGGADGFPWSVGPASDLLKRATDGPIGDSGLWREALLSTQGLEPLPTASSVSLYYIRAVKNNKFFGGEDKEFTIFTPEFLFVFDLGFPAKSGLLCKWEAVGTGDPDFPDFSSAVPRSIYTEDSAGLIYPAVTGDLMIGVRKDVSEEEVMAKVQPFCSQLERVSAELYLAKVKPFHERQVGETIEAHVDFVRYTELNAIVRLIDFSPGWRCSKLV